ncbi:MAG: rhomboid family intramembrane serine protease [Thermoplasmatota archaeon]
MLSVVAILALAAIAVALVVAWTGRFLAVGALALASVAVFILDAFGGSTICVHLGGTTSSVKCGLGLSSDLLLDGHPLGALQMVTHMFVHGDFFHLLGNLIILLAFALPFEERVGPKAITAFYLVTGLAAAGAQLAVNEGSMLLVGASGAVFGLIGAFAAAFPRQIVPLPMPLLFIMIFVRMQVWIGAVVFGAMQFLLLSWTQPGDNTAYWAHIGGLAMGLALGGLARRGAAARSGGMTAAGKGRPVDLAALGPFARDEKTQDALTQAQDNIDLPDVHQAWLERFFRSAACPICQHGVAPRREGSVVCTRGHRFDVRAGAPSVTEQAGLLS